MSLLSEKKLTQIEAGKRLRLTDRQIRNIFKRYQELGDQGVISKKLGKPGNRQIPKDLKIKALQLIKGPYEGFGPTLTAEKLLENQAHSFSKKLDKYSVIGLS
ncbi:MAG: helix-turn-helix domain-containing protein [Verrucomicrobia bacterium]|nr:helix-turn-helix domain-containing protein [Verrucomicrobiota bacterium]